MKVKPIKFLSVAVILGALWSGHLSADPLPDLVQRIRASVVNISATSMVTYSVFGWEDFLNFWGVPKERRHQSLGSGVIIDRSGYVVTNNHVVARAKVVSVTLLDRKSYQARVVGRDPKLDVALLQIRDKAGRVPSGLTSARMGNSEKVRIAETVLAIGNPFGLQHSVSRGIISAKHRTIGVGPLDNFLQTDAAINPGNSGGPLFNTRGEVIGINTAIYSNNQQSAGVGFSIPINEVTSILGDLKKYGRVPRPWLGVLVERMTPQLKVYYGLGRSNGVLVYKLVRGGPAGQAGLRQGDIIFKASGKEVREIGELEKLLLSKRPNGEIRLDIQRGPAKIKKTIRLKDFPSQLDELPRGVI